MKKIYYFFFLCSFIFLSGCSTKSSFNKSENFTQFTTSSKFQSVEVIDKTNFVPSADINIVLTEEMQQALLQSLTEQNLIGMNDYSLVTYINKYEPGNAFHRWLLPGAGATILNVICHIYNNQGVEVAQIPVERSISAGGGYTIGAWKEVFNEVAEEIAHLLKKETKI